MCVCAVLFFSFLLLSQLTIALSRVAGLLGWIHGTHIGSYHLPRFLPLPPFLVLFLVVYLMVIIFPNSSISRRDETHVFGYNYIEWLSDKSDLIL